MSRSTRQVNQEQWYTFAVYDGSDAPVTGLVNGNFTKLLYKDGAANAQTVTIAEISDGVYTATFTPNATGLWTLLIRHATHNKRGWMEHYDIVTSDLSTVASGVSDLSSRLPAALVNGRIDAEVGAIAAGAINGDSFAPDTYNAALFSADFFARIWAEIFSGDTASAHLLSAKNNGSTAVGLLGGVKRTSTMTSEGTTSIIYDTTLTEADGHWVGCLLQMVGTSNAGLRRYIIRSSGSELEVYPPFPYAMPTGHAYQIYGSPAPASPKAIAEMLLDLAATVDGLTVRQALRIALAALAGKSSGGPLSDTVRAVNDSKDRITASIDAQGHRTTVVVDAT